MLYMAVPIGFTDNTIPPVSMWFPSVFPAINLSNFIVELAGLANAAHGCADWIHRQHYSASLNVVPVSFPSNQSVKLYCGTSWLSQCCTWLCRLYSPTALFRQSQCGTHYESADQDKNGPPRARTHM
ncbi:hypothetical protein J6590_019656 [Homalodisca vitripennis]|nr:hypothetical protein J6590_019656 [Homalodisca vitripennis]